MTDVRKEPDELLGELHNMLSYNPETGVMIWLHRPQRHFKDSCYQKTWNKRFANTEIRTKTQGYYKLYINSVPYLAHRVAWAIYYGEWPNGFIDHINGDRGDNRITNLRVVNKKENSKNVKMQSNNTSGVTGVCWFKNYGKWMATIRCNGKDVFLGYFDDITEAAKARKAAEIKYGFHENHGRV